MGSDSDRSRSLIDYLGRASLPCKSEFAEERPLYLIFVALPLPLIFPIYKRYLRGTSIRAEKPRTLFISAAASVLLGSANGLHMFRSSRSG